VPRSDDVPLDFLPTTISFVAAIRYHTGAGPLKLSRRLDTMLLRASPALRAAVSCLVVLHILPSTLAQSTHARRYATGAPTPANKPNWGIYLAGAGVAGLATYLYIDGPAALKVTDKAKEIVKPRATNTESPLSAKEFTEFKLKEVKPYNWNTDRYVAVFMRS
jgi:hypothetical protein